MIQKHFHLVINSYSVHHYTIFATCVHNLNFRNKMALELEKLD